MLVSEFVKEYNDIKIDSMKAELVQKHIINKYVSIAVKNAVFNESIKGSVVTDDNGILYIDMASNKINFVYNIIILYTDLTVDTHPDGLPKMTEMYDLLIQHNLINRICYFIGEDEIQELNTINQIKVDEWHERNSSIMSLMLQITDKATRTLAELLAALPLLLEKPEIKELFSGVNLDNLMSILKGSNLETLNEKISSSKIEN